jgi:hypothetical protein
MNRLLRVVLIWVMAFAVPAQGMASGVMPGCDPQISTQLQQIVAERPTHTALGDAHQASVPEAAPADFLDSSACTACVACYSAVPIVNTTAAAFDDGTGSADFPWNAARLRSFVVALPERPPRPVLV